MSAVPPPYIPETYFAAEALRPIVTAGLPGSKMDNEFINIAITLNKVRSRLGEIQRDDGIVRNAVIPISALTSDLLALIGDGAFRIRGQWQTGTDYEIGDVFSNDLTTYLVFSPFTSIGVSFNPSSAYVSVLGSPPDIGNVTRDVFDGDGVRTSFPTSVNPVTSNNFRVFVDGEFQLGNFLTNEIEGGGGINVIFMTPPPAGSGNVVIETGIISTVSVAEISDSSVTTSKIANLAVTGAKIADATIIGSKIAAGGITSTQLADNTIVTAKIENGAVSNAKLALDAVSGDKLQANAVGSDKLAAGSVTTSKIAAGAVSTAALVDGAVSATKLGTDAVETVKIKDANVTTAKLADASVETAKVKDAAVTAPKLSGAQTGTAPVFGVRAWAQIDGVTAANTTGTYTRAGTTVTVAATAHGFLVGHTAYLDFQTGSASDGAFVVASVIDANNFTVTHGSSGSTSGGVIVARVTVRAQGNISSVSDMGAGTYTLNFTTPLPSTNYAVLGTTNAYGPGNGQGIVNVASTGSNFTGAAVLKTVNSLTVLASTNGVPTDMGDVSIAILG